MTTLLLWEIAHMKLRARFVKSANKIDMDMLGEYPGQSPSVILKDNQVHL
jgi:hypothetical protein